MSPEAIGSIFSGLVLLVGALATYTANRSRRIGEDQRALRRQARSYQRRLIAALSHIFRLETLLAERGLAVPSRPAALEPDDDDDAPAVAPLPPAATGEAHGGG